MAIAINFYKQKKYDCFKDTEETVKFTIKMNDLFDALNRRYPKEGIRKNSSDIQVFYVYCVFVLGVCVHNMFIEYGSRYKVFFLA